MAGCPRRRASRSPAYSSPPAPLAAQGNGSSSDGETTLRVSTWGNDSRLKLTQQAVDAFTKANPDIEVNVENSEWTSYWDKLATATAANDSPDVIQMDESYIAAYGSRGALLDLDTVKNDLDLSAMDAKVLDTGKVGGTFVGAPIGTANFSVAVNPKVLQQAGVKMPDDKTWTWDDLANASAQVTAKLGSKGVYGFDGFGTGTAELGAWARQRGEEVWPTDGQTAVSAATITSYFDYANKLIQTKATPAAVDTGRELHRGLSTPRSSRPTRPPSTCCSTHRSQPSAPPAAPS